MKKLVYVIIILFVVNSGLISCSKETGEIGPKGEQGIQGKEGIPGKDGAVIHKGNGIPATTLGNVGDMYLDVTNSMLYGPKTATDWGKPLNLKGNQGPTGPMGPNGKTGEKGADGSKILSARVVSPSPNAGAIGDYFLNLSNGDFYGPKTASGWGGIT